MRVAIGDIHGRDAYKKFIKDEYSEIYFLGDYFDSHEAIPAVTQIRIFRELVELARTDSRIHLCLGNHDYHYLIRDKNETYSGFQYYSRFDIYEALKAADDLFAVVYETPDKFLISHAGVTKTFLASCLLEKPTDINERYKQFPDCLVHYRMGDTYGNHPMNSPIWVRPQALFSDMIDDYTQIVGHSQTRSGKVEIIEKLGNTRIVLADTALREAYEF